MIVQVVNVATPPLNTPQPEIEEELEKEEETVLPEMVHVINVANF